MMTPEDRRYLALAIRLGWRGVGTTAENPSVGCLLVKDGRIIGRGWTQPGGRPHAEPTALQQAGDEARGATAYVSLEPCSHHGKTPPCAETLIAAGIRRVVYAQTDPDPRVGGRGLTLLREAGVELTAGDADLQAEAGRLHAGFFSRLQRQRPWVTLKLATSLDGRIALANGESQWITGPQARLFGHRLRAGHDAILIGSGTLRQDDPSLTCRLPGLEQRSPIRLVLSSSAALQEQHQLMLTAQQTPCWLITDSALPPAALTRYQQAGVRVLQVEDTRRLDPVLHLLAAEGVNRLLLEGGCQLATAFLKAGRVDALWWIQHPMLLGGDSRPAVGTLDLSRLSDAAALTPHRHLRLGGDTASLYLL